MFLCFVFFVCVCLCVCVWGGGGGGGGGVAEDPQSQFDTSSILQRIMDEADDKGSNDRFICEQLIVI